MTTNAEPAKLKAVQCSNSGMKKIIFTQQLRRFTEVPEVDTDGLTLRSALEDAFRANQRLRGYVLDDQGDLRQHVVVFVDGQRLRDRTCLDEDLPASCTIHVLQALSGG
jgi:molybdopterin synthase sulfur carrier subunit